MAPQPEPLVLAVDQGTSATKAIALDQSGRTVSRASVPVATYHPEADAVVQDPEEVWRSVEASIERCLSEVDPGAVVSVGISSQRESVVLWDRTTGRHVAPLVSWRDRRGTQACADVIASGRASEVVEATGLPVDAAFSAAKLSWLLDQVDPDRTADLCAGTVDSWLLHRFGCGHVIEMGNASRTQLLDVHRGEWDAELAKLFRIPEATLPAVRPSRHPFGTTSGLRALPDGVPITAVLADSHAALFAHAGWERGVVKATYGTGSSVMRLAPQPPAEVGLCFTIAWAHDEISHALEGNILASGSTLVWLCTLLGCDLEELLSLAATSSADGVHLVPAFNGLGAPHWDPSAAGLVTGLTLGTSRGALARAGLEAIAFQVGDVVDAMERCGDVAVIRGDGGPSSNPALMQLQADTIGHPVDVTFNTDLSAVGAGYLAGIAVGLWDLDEVAGFSRPTVRYEPAATESDRHARRDAWHRAVARSRAVL